MAKSFLPVQGRMAALQMRKSINGNHQMKSSVKIQVIFHCPVFTKKEAMDYLNLDKWPRGLKHIEGWKELKHLVLEKRARPMRVQNLSYLCWVLSPEFYFSKTGLYLTDMNCHSGYAIYAKKVGKFKAEGLSNHIHLDWLVRNRLGQFEIGVRAIRAWIPSLRQIAQLKQAVIYLNGAENFTLCIYSDPKANELKDLNSLLKGGSELISVNADKFVKWAL